MPTIALTIARAVGIRGGLAIAFALALISCWVGWSRAADARDEARTELAAALALAEALKLDLALHEQAARERQADAATIGHQQEDLNDALSHPGDDADARRLRSLCVKLRQQSAARFDTTPACHRFAGDTGAGGS